MIRDRDQRSTETSEVLNLYETGGAMKARDIAIMRVFLREWAGDDRKLHALVDHIIDRSGIDTWLERAANQGISPL